MAPPWRDKMDASSMQYTFPEMKLGTKTEIIYTTASASYCQG